MNNFRTFDLSVDFYRATLKLNLKGDARDQLNRAARSISLNLAEGRGKRTLKDQLRFFQISFGSLHECQALLILEGLDKTEVGELADRLAAHLFLLIRNAKKGGC